jgi:hypothetical protein
MIFSGRHRAPIDKRYVDAVVSDLMPAYQVHRGYVLQSVREVSQRGKPGARLALSSPALREKVHADEATEPARYPAQLP